MAEQYKAIIEQMRQVAEAAHREGLTDYMDDFDVFMLDKMASLLEEAADDGYMEEEED